MELLEEKVMKGFILVGVSGARLYSLTGIKANLSFCLYTYAADDSEERWTA